MGLAKKTTSLHQTFTTSQTNVDIISPPGGDYLFIWSAIIEATGAYELKFPVSGSIIKGSGGALGIMGVNKQGLPSETVQITCDANTTIRVMFDEI